MKRLTEESLSANTPEATLAELVRSAAPFHANPFRKRLLLQRVSRAHQAKPRWSLRPAFGALALAALGSAGIASASYGWWKGRVDPTPSVSVQHRVAPTPAPAVPAKPAAPPAAPEAESAAEPEPVAKAASPTPLRREARQVKQRATQDGEDPSEVLEAIRALRKRGDAARAQVLLDQYLKAHPSGALSEDALVLSIEAALARHDPRAADYARRYLSRFPRGRFQALAQRVLSTP